MEGCEVERSEDEAVYSWYVKHPATHAYRKQTFGTPAAFSIQSLCNFVKRFSMGRRSCIWKFCVKTILKANKGKKVRASTDIPQHGQGLLWMPITSSGMTNYIGDYRTEVSRTEFRPPPKRANMTTWFGITVHGSFSLNPDRSWLKWHQQGGLDAGWENSSLSL